MNVFIESYRTHLFKNGFLNINLKDLYPEYMDSFKSNFIDKISKINNITSIQFDGMIPAEYSLDYLKSLYSEKKYDVIDEPINIKSNSDTISKLVYKLVYKTPQYELLKEIKTKLHEINSTNFQSWLEYNIKPGDESYDIIQEIYNRIYLDFYDTKLPESFGCRFTCFEKDDLIVSHRDAYDTSNKCVILIYLNDDYEDGFGGELIIENKEIVKPIFGQISILDFTKHNVIHEVTKINGDFKRCALIQFL
jgi:Rps23 Pro-64 3,4-dihydroxylase Tpa1-like proline 4-hydroxylase